MLDAEHFYVNELMIDLPSILYQIQQWHDGKTAHGVSGWFTAIANEICLSIENHREPNKSIIISYLHALAMKGVAGTPFKKDGTLFA